jgi:hypothetical protein
MRSLASRAAAWLALCGLVLMILAACGDEGQQPLNCSDVVVPTYTRFADGGIAGASARAAIETAIVNAAAANCITSPSPGP